MKSKAMKNRMLNRQYQDGMTAAGWLIIIGLVIFFIFLAIKLVPAYMEFGSIKSSLNSVAEQKYTNKNDTYKLINGRFNINNIDVVKATDVKILETSTGKELSLEYEKRVALFGNISALMDFQHKVELK